MPYKHYKHNKPNKHDKHDKHYRTTTWCLKHRACSDCNAVDPSLDCNPRLPPVCQEALAGGCGLAHGIAAAASQQAFRM